MIRRRIRPSSCRHCRRRTRTCCSHIGIRSSDCMNRSCKRFHHCNPMDRRRCKNRRRKRRLPCRHYRHRTGACCPQTDSQASDRSCRSCMGCCRRIPTQPQAHRRCRCTVLRRCRRFRHHIPRPSCSNQPAEHPVSRCHQGKFPHRCKPIRLNSSRRSFRDC